MMIKKLFFPLVFGLSTHFAWASSDNFCTPNWALNQRGYDRCSSLPIISPSNDTRVNLKLLLVNDGFATVQAKPISKEEVEFGYGKVPFSLETFESNIFKSKDKTGSSNSEDKYDSYGAGSRCVSNDTGKADFIHALEQSRELTQAERTMLTKERQKLNPGCVDVSAAKVSNNVNISDKIAKNCTSSTCKQFMRYITAATAFYEGRFVQAESDFSYLIKSEQPWLKEASLYMLGRTELNLSQQNAFDSAGFPELEKVDKKALMASEVKFTNYLKHYPSGRYASSARGLLRRIYWLSNQPEKLADEYGWQLNHPESPQHNLTIDEFVQEADNKLLMTANPRQIKNPLLLATLDVSLMRHTDPSGTKQISFSDLQKQQTVFAGHKALYEYVLAAHRFYVQKDAAKTLQTLSDKIPAKMTYLDFSRLVLRGLALEAKKDYLGARTLWLRLLQLSRQPLQAETLQLALALNYEHSNELDLVFQPNSPISDPAIRSILLRSGASPDLLRQMIKSKSTSSRERHIALYTLLYKDLLQGQYRNYGKDYPLLPGDAARYTTSPGMDYGEKPHLALFTWSANKSDDSYQCPSTLDTAKRLAANPKDPHGLICLGDFVNSNDLDSDPAVMGISAPRSSAAYGAVLGSAPSHFPGKLFSRGEGYKIIIADAKAAPDLKAYALYRSIHCYATAGYNHCGGKAVDTSVRKSWFKTLKTRFANTVWAKSLKYYW
jgi:hypothetical protein